MADRVLQYGVESDYVRMQSLSPYIRRVAEWYAQITCRGISVMSIVGKVFARVLNERVKVWTVDKVTYEQEGFRVGRGCVDQVFVVRQAVEKTIEKDKEAHMAFVDL